MNIDLGALKREKKSQLDLDFLLNLDTINYYGDEILLPNPFSVKGKLYIMNDKVFLTSDINTVMEVNCSRCLKPFTYQFSSKVNAELVNEELYEEEEDEDPGDIILYHNNIIDLAEIIKDNIFMNIPIQTLCDRDCKGICAKCGIDLNEEQCRCNLDKNEEEKVIDPRLAKLKELL
ncbi:YceD family protein [Alkaliphilus peptidifermentans]|uniref:DUF177 domain-containing protein n=1 Tax=Alkaliphilus peptidifermentans DSM 18978 TaxID=1120976 RepID=A0A1G5JBF6_9FIRM|nr:DUF177 domain-containing protein [Alkaliphilus peptidifermentans]SCY85048.1 uncharacterized protein SAMN03080606_02734 [Alkaliphilus peptidifermentans DSM 18978]